MSPAVSCASRPAANNVVNRISQFGQQALNEVPALPQQSLADDARAAMAGLSFGRIAGSLSLVEGLSAFEAFSHNHPLPGAAFALLTAAMGSLTGLIDTQAFRYLRRWLQRTA